MLMTIPSHTTQGGSKHDGIASVLRIRHGITTTQNHVKEDLIDFVARRTGKRIIASFLIVCGLLKEFSLYFSSF